MTKIDKFYDIKNLLQCPRCGRKIRFHAGGLVCKKEHRFDISSKGYVNMLQENRIFKGYDQEFFRCRNRFLQAGYYNHVLEAVTALVKEFTEKRENPEEPAVVIDAGCGEGYYSSGLFRALDGIQILAFDISADAIKMAARDTAPIKWMVADITNIPVRDGAADCVLDIFTPANYGEFSRILKPQGRVVKVIPGIRHLEQLRQAAAPLLRNSEYSNTEVLEYFDGHFGIDQHISVSRTMAVSHEDLSDLVRMTPLLFDVDKNILNLDGVKEITIEAEILAGKRRTGR